MELARKKKKDKNFYKQNKNQIQSVDFYEDVWKDWSRANLETCKKVIPQKKYDHGMCHHLQNKTIIHTPTIWSALKSLI